MIEVNRYSLNDDLTNLLYEYGWTDADEEGGLDDEEADRLNELVHQVADLLDAFLNRAAVAS